MKNLLCLIMLFIVIVSSAQEYEKGIFHIKLKSEIAKPSKLKTAGTFTDNDKLNRIFKKHFVTTYEQAYPFAKNPELLRIYRISINGDDTNFKKELEDNASELIADINRIPIPIPTYEPSDQMWYIPTQQDPNGWLWHLKRIQAANAWDITKSNSNIKIADIDNNFDILHPDLSSKISPNYDPVTNIVHSARDHSHGTTTSSFAAAQTDGGGQLASSGFNSSLIAYTWEDGVGKALDASDVRHADVITISWYNYCNHNYSTFHDDSLKIKEILDNGTIIVASAGNGPVHCGGGSLYPFSHLVDSRIIIVSSTGIDDRHYYFNQNRVINEVPTPREETHSHNPEVDICAPGYLLMGAEPTIKADGTTNTWPYYGSWSGTSFATPIVAGVCGLMKSINPCLTPSEAQSIIKSTADPIADEYLYPGMLGAGRINAYKAVKKTGTREYDNTTLTGTQSLSAGFGFNLINVAIGNNSNVLLTARKEAVISGTFEVPLGSAFEIAISSTAQNNCQ